MTGSDSSPRPAPRTDPAEESTDRLAAQLGLRAPVSAVFGEPVTRDGITVIPVADVGFGFFGGTGPQADGADPAGLGAGGGARARGYIEIKDGTATYKPVRAPWTDLAVPLAALLAGAVLPPLVRRLAGLRPFALRGRRGAAPRR
ncbi:spore germination protein GerW family protein [Streptomyces sp. NPDC049906]|uniref:spore germination protein GerW family protein n=1 Tax=Streptomyces sp. NPDC049906 TaxID=3155656 RepID=UPI003427BD11